MCDFSGGGGGGGPDPLSTPLDPHLLRCLLTWSINEILEPVRIPGVLIALRHTNDKVRLCRVFAVRTHKVNV